MKKTIALTHPKLKLARLVDSIKHDVKKYIKRERNKQLPADVDYWDFACKFGADEAQAQTIHLSQVSKSIDQAAATELESFYLEIIAIHGIRQSSTQNPWSLDS